jgi:trehalose/maltose hydrolase-like predicted phosphorylase
MSSWEINSKELIDNREEFLESIFTIGNGYMAVRGFDSFKPKKTYEQCTYIAGLFDYYEKPYTDMVNTPNYLISSLYIDNNLVNFDNITIKEKTQVLQMKKGMLDNKYILELENGYQLELKEEKFLSIFDKHTVCVRYSIKSLNFSGLLGFETGINCNVSNKIIHDDQTKDDIGQYKFLDIDEINRKNNCISIKLNTRKTGYSLVEAFTCISDGIMPTMKSCDRYEALKFECQLNDGETKTFTKYISIYTSRDVVKNEKDNLIDVSIDALQNSISMGYEILLKEHIDKYNDIWNISNISISGDKNTEKKLRYNILQLIMNNACDNSNVNIGARGLTHGRYKGCYFWDTEIFMLPFYLYTNVEAAKNLLLYRYNTLNDARNNALEQNVLGARYPWMCTIDGNEQCDTWDIGFSEIHITADIAYAVQHYYEATGDLEFIENYGLEILIETARYWCSRFTYDKDNDCYNLLWVKGPNEYGGVTVNNTYTVKMACYNIKKAIEWIDFFNKNNKKIIDQLVNKISITKEELRVFNDVTKKVVILYDNDKQLYIEDEHFMQMEPINLKDVKVNDSALYNKICFDRLQRYQVVKQADILLLMLLLPQDFNEKQKLVAWEFYEPITTHDSSLSFATHAQIGARIGKTKEAIDYFNKSISLDYDNVMNNTHKEGIHIGASGASWQSIICGFAGIYVCNGQINVEPNIPKQWGEVNFKLYLKGSLLEFTILSKGINIELIEGKCIDINVLGNKRSLSINDPIKIFLN